MAISLRLILFLTHVPGGSIFSGRLAAGGAEIVGTLDGPLSRARQTGFVASHPVFRVANPASVRGLVDLVHVITHVLIP
jgi:hypothetical protein